MKEMALGRREAQWGRKKTRVKGELIYVWKRGKAWRADAVTPTCECINKVNEMLDIEDEEVSLNIKVIQMKCCEFQMKVLWVSLGGMFWVFQRLWWVTVLSTDELMPFHLAYFALVDSFFTVIPAGNSQHKLEVC